MGVVANTGLGSRTPVENDAALPLAAPISLPRRSGWSRPPESGLERPIFRAPSGSESAGKLGDDLPKLAKEYFAQPFRLPPRFPSLPRAVPWAVIAMRLRRDESGRVLRIPGIAVPSVPTASGHFQTRLSTSRGQCRLPPRGSCEDDRYPGPSTDSV